MYRHGGRLRRLTLGTYPPLTLADARDKAKAALHSAGLGGDPAADKKAERLAETIAELADGYLNMHAKPHKRSWREDERLLNREILPRWRNRKVRDVKRRDIIALLDAIVERGAPIQANRVLALTRKMFNWGISRDILEVNPCAQVKHPGNEQQRQRVLTEAEIRSVWLAFEQVGPLLGRIFQLRLLTAQRGAEVQAMRWKDVDLSSGWWTIPPTVAKNKLAHRVPLSAPVRDILHRLQVDAGDGEWVFPSPTRMGRYVVNIQKAALEVRSHSGVDFVPHDLRRTAASMMTGMGIPRLVVGKILNHVESGATRTYDRHSYDGEKRQALEAWAQRLWDVLAGRQAKVVRLPDRI
jgi:integrase